MPLRHVPLLLALTAIISLSGCATYYVDNGLKDVPSSEYRHPVSPQPVRLQFQFTTNGAANPRGTNYLKNDVVAVVAESGLFSRVSTDPFATGAVLNVTINDVGNRTAGFAKGFATGLTLGLAGNTVTDGYVCTVEYAPAPGAPKIVKTRDNVIYTTVGAKGAPPHATETADLYTAVNTAIRNVVANALKDLADDPAAQFGAVARARDYEKPALTQK